MASYSLFTLLSLRRLSFKVNIECEASGLLVHFLNLLSLTEAHLEHWNCLWNRYSTKHYA